MRKINRIPLSATVIAYLKQRQQRVNHKLIEGNLDTTQEWSSARQTKNMGDILSALRQMIGKHERCMYCLDSHGSDIEHFRPKSLYPKRMFLWRNLLLCCTECGRFKGNQFPLDGKRPLLIDPSKEEPWRYLDFDPDTGNITARFDLQTYEYFAKGEKTVEVLQLDRREALAAGYIKTYHRLSNKIQRFLNEPYPLANNFINELKEADDHGLLGWCFLGTGQNEMPFKEFRQYYPNLWLDCARALGY